MRQLPPVRLVAVALVVIFGLFFPLGIPWLSGALLGSTIIYLWSRPPARDLLLMTGIAWALLIFRSLLSPIDLRLQLAHPDLLAFYWGHASIILLTLRGPSTARYGAVWFPAFVVLRRVGLTLFDLGDGPTTDGAMLLIDHAIGDPAYRFGQWLEPHRAVRLLLWICYNAVSLLLPLAYGAALPDRARCLRLLWSWAAAAILGVLCYKLVPVSGPSFAFDGWPALPEGGHGRGWRCLRGASERGCRRCI